MGLDMYLYNNKHEEVCYWRKANAINAWFNKNVQEFDDCEQILVPRDKIRNLISDCENVLQHKGLAEDVLPTEVGFFFGTYEYDELYFDKISDTIEQLNKALSENKGNFYYMAWW